MRLRWLLYLERENAMRRISSASKGSSTKASARVASRSASRTKASGSAPAAAASSSSRPAVSADVAQINKGIAAVKKKFFKPR